VSPSIVKLIFSTALLWGDPHFLTHDGLDYTFNGIGEFTMIKTVDNSFHLQARTAQMINAQGVLVAATSFVAFAAQEAGSVKVQVELGSSNEGELDTIDTNYLFSLSRYNE